jgi:squalene cyclase
LCASCLLDVSKEDSEPEGNSREESVTEVVKKEKKLKKAVSKEDSEPEGNSREESVTGVVKKEKKLKKAVAALRIDFEAKAIAIKEDASKTKSRVKKTPKKFDA